MRKLSALYNAVCLSVLSLSIAGCASCGGSDRTVTLAITVEATAAVGSIDQLNVSVVTPGGNRDATYMPLAGPEFNFPVLLPNLDLTGLSGLATIEVDGLLATLVTANGSGAVTLIAGTVPVTITIDSIIQDKCGDGVVDAGEECDDGNTVDGDGCESDCTFTPAVCGNNVLEDPEECDDGNTVNGDGCSDVCVIEAATCGAPPTCDAGEDCMNCPTDCGPCPGVCGDGTIDPPLENCDGANLGGVDCVDLGFTGGTLTCDASCNFNTSGCTGVGPVCGDGTIDLSEDCDGANLGGSTCVDLGFDAGALACDAVTCFFDTGACVNFTCGDGSADGTEVCDGADLNGQTCVTQGFVGGTLACNGTCTGYDTAGCLTMMCGNGAIEGTEQCDGAALGGATCASLGFSGGVLTCGAGCTYDTSGCFTMTCGNGFIEGTETCDGADLGGQSCTSLGFASGTLACGLGCTSFDTSGCTNCGNFIIDAGETCDDGDSVGGDGCSATCQLEPGMHEIFAGAPADGNDLCGTTIGYTYNGLGYDTTTFPITGLPIAPGTGAPTTSLALSDDGSTMIALSTSFPFFGVLRTSMFVEMNGNVTFGSASGDYTETALEHYAAGNPRASVFWDDFNPGAGGATVIVDQFFDHVTVTWTDVLPFGAPSTSSYSRSTFQVTFYTFDYIEMSYLYVSETDGLVGLSNGAGGTAPPETDLYTGIHSEGFHEIMAGADDLDNVTLRFIPTPSLEGYVTTTSATGVVAFPDTPGSGSPTMPLALTDDGNALVTFPAGFTFPFFGLAETAVYVNDNGNLTFDGGDSDFSPSIADHYSQPRIAGYWQDIVTGAGSAVTYDAYVDHVTITYSNILQWPSGPATVSFQIQLYDSGEIRITYLGVGIGNGLVGVSSGVGDPRCPLYTTDVNRSSNGIFELWTGAAGAETFDLVNDRLLFTPNFVAAGGFNYAVTATVLTYPTAIGTGTTFTGTLATVSGCDDCSESYDFVGFSFPYYNNRYDRVWVNSNGSITLGEGSGTFGESINGHLNPLPRISVFWDDLYPIGAGDIFVDEFPDRVVITWDGVAPYATMTPGIYVQVELFADGRIRIAHLGTTQLDALIGVSTGGRVPAVAIPEVNFQ